MGQELSPKLLAPWGAAPLVAWRCVRRHRLAGYVREEAASHRLWGAASLCFFFRALVPSFFAGRSGR
ncbi:MAG: hypothetical protein QHJ73_16085, partial [Armatimonadota bacterium]|nr:hypothetical protein [Armatimonadota bacterium]